MEGNYVIITTEATEHVGTIGRREGFKGVVTLGAADEGVVGGVEAGAKRLNRQIRALGIGRTAYGPGWATPERAIAAAIIAARVVNNTMRFFISATSRRAGLISPALVS